MALREGPFKQQKMACVRAFLEKSKCNITGVGSYLFLRQDNTHVDTFINGPILASFPLYSKLVAANDRIRL